MTGMKTAKARGYTPFVLAAIYTGGVVMFSVGQYLKERTHILEHQDAVILHAAHAADEFLQDTLTDSLLKAGSLEPASWIDVQAHLNRFADACRFDLVGAAGFSGGELRRAVFGSRHHAAGSSDPVFIENLLRPMLSSPDRLSADGIIRLETAEAEPFGRVRMAYRYRSITADSGYAILVFRSTAPTSRLLNLLAWRTAGIGIALYVMVFPLIILYHFAQKRSSRQSAELNARLQEDFIKLKERESELEDAIGDLERFNAVAIGRESRIIELKAEVNTLLEEMNREKRYHIDSMD